MKMEEWVKKWIEEQKIPKQILINYADGTVEIFNVDITKNTKQFVYGEDVEYIPVFRTDDGFELDWDEMAFYLAGVIDREDGSNYEFVY